MFGLWAASDVCLELSFPPYCFVPLSLSGFLMNGKKHLKSNMSEQLPLTKYNTNGFGFIKLHRQNCLIVLIPYHHFKTTSHF